MPITNCSKPHFLQKQIKRIFHKRLATNKKRNIKQVWNSMQAIKTGMLKFGLIQKKTHKLITIKMSMLKVPIFQPSFGING
ncbi:Uncharacterised protein [Mycobacteroides abscessus subsp. abscessus]|nr:Uncharacterised protein [Mycobacteroides abscessus subsp. abscessus]